MTRKQLEHAIRAACDVAGDTEIYVFGSQAILGQFPDAPAALRRSVEVDVTPKTRVDRVDAIDGALGELSPFHETHGFYVHGLTMEGVTLPAGWKGRLVAVKGPMTYGNVGLCLEGHDLAASKLAAFRPKDRDFVRVLLQETLISAGILRRRIATTKLSRDALKRITEWLTASSEALGS